MKYHFKFLLAVILGALFIMLDAFYNGYPIFFTDSNEYMLSGYELFYPNDHPITYGIFIKLFSFNGLTLWTVVFFQALILSWLIFLTVKLLLGEHKLILRGLGIIAFLAFFTGISWTASQVLTDIFTPIAFLSAFLIVFDNNKPWKFVLLYLIFIIAVGTHMSHVVEFSLVLAFAFVLRKWLVPKAERRKRTIHIVSLLTLSILSELPMRPSLDASKYIIFMGAMMEQGIAQEYLHEYCGTRNYKLCQYKDSLPTSESAFLWDPHSPLYKMGGWSTESRNECQEITYETFSHPKYIGLHIAGSLKVTGRQLLKFDICDGNAPFTQKGWLNYQVIDKYIHHELGTFLNAYQQKGVYPFITFFIKLLRVVQFLSMAVIVMLLVFWRKLFTGNIKAAAVLFLFCIVANAWNLATFSTVASRYQCKVAWLSTFLAIILLIRFIDTKKAGKMPS